MFNWFLPHKEQDMCERRLSSVMKRLKVEDYDYNWDRNSCFIEFRYLGKMYRMEHSVKKAKRKGVIMSRNGLDCLIELAQSLEDLSQIIGRGTYKLENWISGMRKTSSADDTSEYLEEVHIRYKPIGKQKQAEFIQKQPEINQVPESPLGDFDPNQILPRRRRGTFSPLNNEPFNTLSGRD